jgi:hypothetical protein
MITKYNFRYYQNQFYYLKIDFDNIYMDETERT